jgi:hypothetical protein
MRTEPWERIENELRLAVAARLYRKVELLAAQLGDATRWYIQTLPKGDPRAREAGRRLDNALSWSLVMMHAARYSCCAELRRVSTATRYTRRFQEPAGASSMVVDG